MGDSKQSVLKSETDISDSGVRNFSDKYDRKKFDMICYALDHMDREVYVSRPDGKLVFWNRLAAKGFHLSLNSSDDIYTWDLDQTVTPEIWQNLVNSLRADKKEREYIFRRKEINTSYCYVKISVHIAKDASDEEFVWIFCQDISAHEEYENRIKELNSLMNTVLDNIPVYLFVKDVTPDFRYIYWNKAFERYSHIPREKAIGNTDFDIFPNREDAENFRRDDNQLLYTGKENEYIESYEADSGEMRTVKTLKTLVRDDDGKPQFLVGVSWDITDLKNSEKELIMARMKAEQSDKLKSAFLANMSHEIRTPLNAILGFTRLVAETENQEEKSYYLDIVENNSELLTQLINDILDLSKIEAGSLEFDYKPIRMREMCRKIYEVHSVKMKEGVSLVLEEEIPDLHMLAEGNRLFQVLSNLITNASKFTKEGCIRFGYRLAEKYVEFYVEDTGCGIPKDKVTAVFDRFTKLNTFAQGSGLGLAICKMLVEKMKGKISVDSEENKGSIFKFTIPYQEIAIQNDIKDMETKEIKENVGTGTTILVAEDVESNYLLLKAILGKTYNLVHAWNGKEAIEMYEQVNPALILMDIKMPEMGGLEATRIIREKSQSIPIIALTAFAFDDDRIKAQDAGCNDYLTKPLSATLLKQMIIKYI